MDELKIKPADLNLTAKGVLLNQGSRHLPVPVVKEETEQDKFVRFQKEAMEEYQYEVLRAMQELSGRASGNHFTKKPSSKRVQAKIKAQKAAMKLEMAKKAKLKKDQESQ